jgi:hypothetical protein
MIGIVLISTMVHCFRKDFDGQTFPHGESKIFDRPTEKTFLQVILVNEFHGIHQFSMDKVFSFIKFIFYSFCVL